MNRRTIPAVVPAAGKSRRMGQPKLLMEFEGQPLIGRVVNALLDGGADPVIVVTPPGEVPEGPPVAAAAKAAGARVITPATRPLEMRESVELALDELVDDPPDAFVLTPADSPGINACIVTLLLERWAETTGSIVIPRAGGRHAHPIILPWDLARQIPSLPRDLGINALVAANPHRLVELEVRHTELAVDLNTPEDLDRWNHRQWSVLTVRLFAVAKERVGRAQVDVELPLPATVADLRLALALQHPALAPLAPRVMVAIDSDYATDNSLILPGAKLALIPPVSGG
jgi:molybdenum cofactor cytidylyltransferase